MRWSIAKLSAGTKISLVLASTAMLAACTTYYSQEAKYEGHHNYLVAAPAIEDLDELEVAKLHRIKVASIEVITPDSEEKILSITATVNQRRRQKIIHISGDYILDQGLEPYTIQALSYLFEIDPNSKKTAFVDTQVRVSSRLKHTGGLCSAYWLTRVSAGFVITLADSADGSKTKEAFLSEVEEESCADNYYVPEAEEISEHIQEAFENSLLKAIEDRNAHLPA